MEDTAKISNICYNELNFLKEISDVLASCDDSQILVTSLKNVFEKYFCINNFQIFIKDSAVSALRDFVKNWIVIEKNKQEELVENIFNRLKKAYDKGFVLNNKFVKYKASNIIDIFKDVKEKENLLYFPVFNEKNLIGVIELNFDKSTNIINEQILIALRIAVSQINTSVVNKILNRNMQVQIKFQNVMKSIAKLIETQFELDYILPIIGELVDMFVTEHLIYIFVKDEKGEFRLFWPVNCQDKKLFDLLKKFNDKKSHLISKDGKTGLFAIRNEEKTTGIIAASSNMDKLSQYDIDYLLQLSAQASITTQRANSYAQVLKFATMDALTGLNNRRQFEVRLKQEFANAKRKNKPLCCIMLDIDYFKQVNDTWGHSAGDCVLKNVAKIVTGGLREYDIASRYGGEEFCILLPDTKINEAVFVAQRLRKSVEEAKINISEDEILGTDFLNVTISVGVSEYNSSLDVPEKLYQCADIALYEAKKRGRNRVVVFDNALL